MKNGKKDILKINFEEYERYERGDMRKVTIYCNGLKDGLRKLVDNIPYFNIYIEENEERSDEEIIEDIECNNGDGANYITFMSFNNDILIENQCEIEEEIIE